VGTGTTVNLTGLNSGDTYYVQAFEYNNASTNADYLTSTATNNPTNFTTVIQFVNLPLNTPYNQNFNTLPSTGTSQTWSAGTTINGW
jgi:hypothetical protein